MAIFSPLASASVGLVEDGFAELANDGFLFE
jgi:hypothetical protein